MSVAGETAVRLRGGGTGNTFCLMASGYMAGVLSICQSLRGFLGEEAFTASASTPPRSVGGGRRRASRSGGKRESARAWGEGGGGTTAGHRAARPGFLSRPPLVTRSLISPSLVLPPCEKQRSRPAPRERHDKAIMSIVLTFFYLRCADPFKRGACRCPRVGRTRQGISAAL